MKLEYMPHNSYNPRDVTWQHLKGQNALGGRKACKHTSCVYLHAFFTNFLSVLALFKRSCSLFFYKPNFLSWHKRHVARSYSDKRWVYMNFQLIICEENSILSPMSAIQCRNVLFRCHKMNLITLICFYQILNFTLLS